MNSTQPFVLVKAPYHSSLPIFLISTENRFSYGDPVGYGYHAGLYLFFHPSKERLVDNKIQITLTDGTKAFCKTRLITVIAILMVTSVLFSCVSPPQDLILGA
jgi:hypothetical protein